MRCARCSFDTDSLAAPEVAPALRMYAERFRHALASASPADLARRPAPGVWSALEYTCHVRDVLLAQRERAVRVLVEDRPAFPPMHRDERAALCRYDAQAPARVLDELAMAADLLALVLSDLDETAWVRPLQYNWPTSEDHDLAWMGRHTVHECHHHLFDVTAGLGAPGDLGPAAP